MYKLVIATAALGFAASSALAGPVLMTDSGMDATVAAGTARLTSRAVLSRRATPASGSSGGA